MHAPYRPYHDRPHIPDLPESPPAVDEADYDRIQRNSCRYDAIAALGTVISRLDELDHDGHTCAYLENLRDYIQNDMEDYHGPRAQSGISKAEGAQS